MRRVLAIAGAVFLLMTYSVSQSAPAVGMPPFSSIQDHGFDQVNLGNLNVSFALPVMHVDGRGLPLDFSVRYNSLIWQITGTAPSQSWVPAGVPDATGAATFGWTRDFPIGTTTYSSTQSSRRCLDGGGGYWMAPRYTYTNFKYVDTLGTSHPFSSVTWIYDSCTDTSSGTWTGYADDNSGFYIDLTSNSDYPAHKVTHPSGTTITGIVTDPNGNSITSSLSTSGTCPGSTCVKTNTLTDTLGNAGLIITSSYNSTTYQYLYPSAGSYQTITLGYTSKNIKTHFECSGIAEYNGTANLPTSLTYPDGTSYSFDYEATPGYPTYTTGRISKVTLPTGGIILYNYTFESSTDGITCSDGTTSSLQRQTQVGSTISNPWTYFHSLYSGTAWLTQMIDPTAAYSAGNWTNILFQATGGNFYETQRDIYQGTGTWFKSIYTCYNGNAAPCYTTAVSLPITRRTATSNWASGVESKTDTFYDSSGHGLVQEVDEYDYGTGAPGGRIRKTLITYASLGNIIDHPATVTIQDGSGNTFGQTTYGYDPHGNATSVSRLVRTGASLSRSFTYNGNGATATARDVNTALTTYTYGSGGCNSAFPTSVSEPMSLSRSITWNCVGAVITDQFDENNQHTSALYPTQSWLFWRPQQTTDEAGYQTNVSYSNSNGAPSWVESTLNFNGVSTVDLRKTTDPFGRPQFNQRNQTQNGSTYDTVEKDYDAMGRVVFISVPYSAGTNPTGGPGTAVHYYDALGKYDPLDRPITVIDAGGGTISYDYTNAPKYVLQTLGPAPSGENAKQKVMQYDALGRLTGVCEVTTGSGSGACGQTGKTGYWTTYAYNVLNNLTSVSQNGLQSRSYSYDGQGRMTSESNPESGTTTYTYDSDATCGNYTGDLVKRVDAVGNTTCYAYDALHRVTSVTYPSGQYSGATDRKCFVYDTVASPPPGISVSNAKTRLAEAYTKASGSCDGQSKKTDLFFSYSERGEITDVWESTPNSGGYYHLNATYWANRAVKKLSGLGLPDITYGADGEGRPNSVMASSGTNPIPNGSSVTYDTFGNVWGLTLGSGDSDSFAFDSNTGRMTQYLYRIGATPQTVTGNLTWNANGTLRQLAITDQITAGNTQTCTYGYDDLARVTSASCGSVWSQTFGLDPLGNLSKSGSVSFQPTYNTATNRITSVGGQSFSYDANGNTLNDTLLSYAWDADGHATTIGSVTVTYDALGRMVDQGGTQIVYSPTGQKLALMSGQSITKAFIPLPGGGAAVYGAGGTLSYFRHVDWLGSLRIDSTPTQTALFEANYAPYGETNGESGTVDRVFAGMNQDTIQGGTAGLYDAMYREYAMYGRWISPDPAGFRAASPANPQTWNRYAYVVNQPLLAVDPLGLCPSGDAYNRGQGETDEHYAARLAKLRCAYRGPQHVDPGWTGFLPLCGVDPFCHLGPFDSPIAQQSNYDQTTVRTYDATTGALLSVEVISFNFAGGLIHNDAIDRPGAPWVRIDGSSYYPQPGIGDPKPVFSLGNPQIWAGNANSAWMSTQPGGTLALPQNHELVLFVTVKVGP